MASGVIVVGFRSQTRRVRTVLVNWRKMEKKLTGE